MSRILLVRVREVCRKEFRFRIFAQPLAGFKSGRQSSVCVSCVVSSFFPCRRLFFFQIGQEGRQHEIFSFRKLVKLICHVYRMFLSVVHMFQKKIRQLCISLSAFPFLRIKAEKKFFAFHIRKEQFRFQQKPLFVQQIFLQVCLHGGNGAHNRRKVVHPHFCRLIQTLQRLAGRNIVVKESFPVQHPLPTVQQMPDPVFFHHAEGILFQKLCPAALSHQIAVIQFPFVNCVTHPFPPFLSRSRFLPLSVPVP